MKIKTETEMTKTRKALVIGAVALASAMFLALTTTLMMFAVNSNYSMEIVIGSTSLAIGWIGGDMIADVYKAQNN
jgi:uncharacterized membrane protein YphA (DoxX/SURF4 family)